MIQQTVPIYMTPIHHALQAFIVFLSHYDHIHRIASAILDSLLDTKAKIITSLISLIYRLMGGLLSEVRDFVDKLLG